MNASALAAGTSVFDESLSWNVLVVTVDASRPLLNCAVRALAVETPVAPAAGDTEVTVGGVVSVWLKTRSTQ